MSEAKPRPVLEIVKKWPHDERIVLGTWLEEDNRMHFDWCRRCAVEQWAQAWGPLSEIIEEHMPLESAAGEPGDAGCSCGAPYEQYTWAGYCEHLAQVVRERILGIKP